MNYAQFVRLRRPVWEAFAGQLAAAQGKRRKSSYDDLEELALRYRQVLHDHALAASRFPRTAAAQRLQSLALEGTRRLTGERGGRRGVVRFFTRTFPLAVQQHRGVTGLAVGLFLMAAVWGLAIAIVRPAMGLSLLGPRAIQGLEEGHLWTESLVSTTPPAFSSSGIATNNISVALSAWSGGILAGLGPLYVILLNGFLLGSIVGVTLHYSMSAELLEFVAAHGPLEITLILVSAGAGLAVGKALVAAGDRPRAVALRDAGRDALAVLVGCVPWFVVLALVEVFVSPVPEFPVALKVALGLALESLFLYMALRPISPEPSDD